VNLDVESIARSLDNAQAALHGLDTLFRSHMEETRVQAVAMEGRVRALEVQGEERARAAKDLAAVRTDAEAQAERVRAHRERRLWQAVGLLLSVATFALGIIGTLVIRR
jgi:hypothetical protein